MSIMFFQERRVECPKCGNTILKRKYDEPKNLLIWTCSCGFEWYMRTKDYEEKQ